MGTQGHCAMKAKTATSNHNKLDANILENAKSLQVGDIYDTMEFDRPLIIGVLFMPASQAQVNIFKQHLETVDEAEFFAEQVETPEEPEDPEKEEAEEGWEKQKNPNRKKNKRNKAPKVPKQKISLGACLDQFSEEEMLSGND